MKDDFGVNISYIHADNQIASHEQIYLFTATSTHSLIFLPKSKKEATMIPCGTPLSS